MQTLRCFHQVPLYELFAEARKIGLSKGNDREHTFTGRLLLNLELVRSSKLSSSGLLLRVWNRYR
ncbi:MAG: hypothetical protein RIS08_1215 [Actinomycetota bacterium]|jgi:hypothetical protein